MKKFFLALMRILLICLGIGLFFAGAFGVGMLLQPRGAKPVFPAGALQISLQEGRLSLSWPSQLSIARCRMAYSFDGAEYTPLGEYPSGSVILEGVSEGQKIYLRLLPIRETVNLLHMTREKEGDVSEFLIEPASLQKPDLTCDVDSVDKRIFLACTGTDGKDYEVYIQDENGEWQSIGVSDGSLICLSAGADFNVLRDRDTIQFTVRTMVQGNGYVSYSAYAEPVSISHRELFGGQLNLTYEGLGDRRYALDWESVEGKYCEVQQWSSEENAWLTRAVLEGNETAYEVGTLPSGSQVRFRVVAYDTKQQKETEDFTADPYEVTFRVEVSPLYCTVWPLLDQPFWENADGSGRLGSIPAGTALCVLRQEGDYFLVRYQDTAGWVDGRYCMIDLAEYLGDLCAYEIKNSDSSIFRVHGYDVPKISNTVIPGYEDICTGEERYLVPLLYPTANRLLQAANMVRRDGYRLRIYDAFRPNEATRYLYSTMSAAMGKRIEAENLGNGDASRIGLTYGSVMTGGRYGLSSFLASSVSAHNRGIAVDLTLEELESGQTLSMQTEMHDLSWYSSTAQNNENADLLARYMMSAGFSDLFSEWWHFQDDDIRAELDLYTYMRKGVSPEGWKKDDTGWRYRKADGSFYTGTAAEIEGREYHFDEDGYCQESFAYEAE